MNTTTIHVGDLVRFHYGKRKVTGVVREDRGPIGIRGRNLYLIDFSAGPENSSQIELPAELLEQPPTWVVLRLHKGIPEPEQSHNVSSVTDNGGPGLDMTLVFEEDFSTDLYACQVSANREISFRIIEKHPGCIRLLFEDPLPDRVKIVCSDL